MTKPWAHNICVPRVTLTFLVSRKPVLTVSCSTCTTSQPRPAYQWQRHGLRPYPPIGQV